MARLPAHAGRRASSTRWAGTTTGCHRAPRAELLRRPLRPVAAVRPRPASAVSEPERPEHGRRSRAELHRAVPAADRRGREGVRGAVAPARPLGGLVDDLHDDRRAGAARLAAGVPSRCRKGPGLSAEAPTLWDVDFRTAVAQAELEDREHAGRVPRRSGSPRGPIGDVEIETTRPSCSRRAWRWLGTRTTTEYGSLRQAALTPLFRVPVPVNAHPLADPEKGTGPR